jgi:hypothetical protein
MESLNVKDLQNICKKRKIRNYSKLRKAELIDTINKFSAVLKIQRWYRNRLINGEECQITFDEVKYPCYGYNVLKGKFIYYNLEPLKQHLISSGDFRDPKTRNVFTDKQLKAIGFDVYFASKNHKFYEQKRRHEQMLLTQERIIDYVTEDLTKCIDLNDRYKMSYQLTSFEKHYGTLAKLCKKTAEYVFNKTMENINTYVDAGLGDFPKVSHEGSIVNSRPKGPIKKIYTDSQLFMRADIIVSLNEIREHFAR